MKNWAITNMSRQKNR